MLVTWYIPIRLSALGVTLTKEEHELFENQTIMDNFLTQVQEMMSRCVVVDDTIIRNYSGLVFEGAQGLLLDTDYLVFAPHLTSSKTGSYNPKKILLENDLQNEDIEFCYVTRSYFTRHGFGPFPTECDKKELFGMDVEEKYNHENEFQGKFRLGAHASKPATPACPEYNFAERLNHTSGHLYTLRQQFFLVWSCRVLHELSAFGRIRQSTASLILS